jgi:phosphatidylserine decarboxylase
VSLDKNSKDNERHSVVLKCADNNEEIAFVQIAGLVARRIVCNLKQGDKVKKGNLYGLIKFGSRVDLYLPKDKVNIVVKEGQSMIGGETIMAYFKK